MNFAHASASVLIMLKVLHALSCLSPVVHDSTLYMYRLMYTSTLVMVRWTSLMVLLLKVSQRLVVLPCKKSAPSSLVPMELLLCGT